MPNGHRRIEGWRTEYRKTNTATATQTIARITTIRTRTTRANIGTTKITIKITTTTIALNLMRILDITNMMIRMITKIITRTTNALAKLSGSQPSMTVRSGMP